MCGAVLLDLNKLFKWMFHNASLGTEMEFGEKNLLIYWWKKMQSWDIMGGNTAGMARRENCHSL